MSVVTNISALSEYNFTPNQALRVDDAAKDSFEAFFRAAMDVVERTNEYQKTADKAQLDYVSGKNDDMLSVLMAQDRAYTALNFTVQVTNKIIESYREIMRIQL